MYDAGSQAIENVLLISFLQLFEKEHENGRHWNRQSF